MPTRLGFFRDPTRIALLALSIAVCKQLIDFSVCPSDCALGRRAAPPPSYQSLFGQVQQARKHSKTIPDFIKNLIFIALGTIGVTIFIASTILIPFTMIIVGASNIQNCPAEHIPLFLLVGGTVWITRNILNFLNKCSAVRIGRDQPGHAADQLCAPTAVSSGASASGEVGLPCGSRATSAATADISLNHPCGSASTSASATVAATLAASASSSGESSRARGRFVINLDHEEDLTRVIGEYQPLKNRRREFLINSFIFLWFITGCVMVYRIFPPEYLDETKPNYCNKAVYLYAFWLVTSVFIVFGLFVSCICCVSITAIFSSHTESGRRAAFAR